MHEDEHPAPSLWRRRGRGQGPLFISFDIFPFLRELAVGDSLYFLPGEVRAGGGALAAVAGAEGQEEQRGQYHSGQFLHRSLPYIHFIFPALAIMPQNPPDFKHDFFRGTSCKFVGDGLLFPLYNVIKQRRKNQCERS